MKVVIDGIEYVPKVDTHGVTDEKIKSCLETLTEIRYFNQSHKMMGLAWNAINALCPDLANLEPDAAYSVMHGEEDN